jgi:L-asparaginase/Glu-tRNA(Gln) amidotransferase subunit D
MSKSKSTINVISNGGTIGSAMREQSISTHSFFKKKISRINKLDILKATSEAKRLMNKVQLIPHPTKNHGFVLVHGQADSGERRN